MLQSVAIAPVDQFKSFKVLESMNFFSFMHFLSLITYIHPYL